MSETTTAVIENVPALITAAKDLWSTPAGAGVVILIVFIGLFYKIAQHPLFQSLMSQREARLKKLDAYLESASPNKSCMAVAADIRDALVFQAATGIYAEEKQRKGLVRLRDNAGASWLDMKRAQRFIDYSTSPLSMKKLKVLDHVGYWWNVAMMWSFVVMAAVVLVAAFMYEPSISMIIGAVLLAAVLIFFAAWSIMQNLPMNAAKRIIRAK